MRPDQDPATETAPETAPPSSDEDLPTTAAEPLVEQDLLVEDVSIDGMCGVY